VSDASRRIEAGHPPRRALRALLRMRPGEIGTRGKSGHDSSSLIFWKARARLKWESISATSNVRGAERRQAHHNVRTLRRRGARLRSRARLPALHLAVSFRSGPRFSGTVSPAPSQPAPGRAFCARAEAPNRRRSSVRRSPAGTAPRSASRTPPEGAPRERGDRDMAYYGNKVNI